nr:galactose oxidase [Iodidimonas gelatinilytica]
MMGAPRTGLRMTALGALMALSAACSQTPPQSMPPQSPYAPMPQAHSNNAAASLDHQGKPVLYSFMGLKAGKRFEDLSTAAFAYDVTADRWTRLAPVPVPEGRLASVAVALDGAIYLFGGYTVAADGYEISTPHTFRYEPETNTYHRLADIPKPVDDSIALAYKDRYIYLVSGWHMDGNVSTVQVFDTKEGVWFNATDFPGVPVFGHAGGLVADYMLVIDGVAVLGKDQGKRRFGLVEQAWLGRINPDDPSDIEWHQIASHGGGPLYRAAGTGSDERGLILFAGGSKTAYNYNGIGYDGTPAQPSARVFGYDPFNDLWMRFADKPVPSMDHRALLPANGAFWTIGGMTKDQQVSPLVDRIDAKE